jgi:hypothetical protein
VAVNNEFQTIKKEKMVASLRAMFQPSETEEYRAENNSE